VKQYGFSLVMTLLAGLVAAGKFIVNGLGAVPGFVVIVLLFLAILGLMPARKEI
jgi:hypothetical protein